MKLVIDHFDQSLIENLQTLTSISFSLLLGFLVWYDLLFWRKNKSNRTNSVLFLEMITNTVRPLLNEIFYLGSRSPILAFKKIESLLHQYKTSDHQNQIAILEHIAKEYHPDQQQVNAQVNYSSWKTMFSSIADVSLDNRSKSCHRSTSSISVNVFIPAQNRNMPNFFVWLDGNPMVFVHWFNYEPICSNTCRKSVCSAFVCWEMT